MAVLVYLVAVSLWPSAVLLYLVAVGLWPSAVLVYLVAVSLWPSAVMVYLVAVSLWPSAVLVYLVAVSLWPSWYTLWPLVCGHRGTASKKLCYILNTFENVHLKCIPGRAPHFRLLNTPCCEPNYDIHQKVNLHHIVND